MKRQVKAPVAAPMAAASGRAPRRPIRERGDIIIEKERGRGEDIKGRWEDKEDERGVHEKVTDLIGTMSLYLIQESSIKKDTQENRKLNRHPQLTKESLRCLPLTIQRLVAKELNRTCNDIHRRSIVRQ